VRQLVLAHNFASQTTRKIKIREERELRGKEKKREEKGKNRKETEEKKDVQRLTSAERRNERDGEMLF